MTAPLQAAIPAELLSDLEQKYFWWQPVGTEARSEARILAQAMDQASFADVRRLETLIGADRLVDAMLHAQPGWLSERSWELWRGRLSFVTGRQIPEEPPRRALHATTI